MVDNLENPRNRSATDLPTIDTFLDLYQLSHQVKVLNVNKL
jgi:hypothetical protein